MDLNLVIAELRTELESVKQVTSALERLMELRKRRDAAEAAALENLPDSIPKPPRGRKKDRSQAAEAGA